MTLDVPLPSQRTSTRLGCWPFLVTLLVAGIGLARLVAKALEIGTAPQQFRDSLWTLGITLLLAAVLALLRWRAHTVRLRACYTTWLLSLILPVLLLPTTWIAPAQSQLAALIQVLILAVYALLVRWIVGARTARGTRAVALWMALASAIMLGYPWLVWGSLGSLTDIILALLAAMLFGWSAAQIIARFWLRSLKLAATTPGRDLLVGGWVIGISLVLMTRNLGFNGGSLVISIAFLSLGWLVMAVSMLGRNYHNKAALNWPAVALLLGGVVAFPLLFADTDTLSLLYVAQAEAGLWGWLAALITLLGGVVLAVLLGLARTWLKAPGAQWGAILLVGLSCVGAAIIYTTWGNPGLHGDALFVILTEQADLTSVAEIDPVEARREAVYVTLVDHANRTQADLRAELDRWGIAYTPYYLVNGLKVEGNLFVLWWLTRNPAVDRVLPAPLLRPLPAAIFGMPGEEAVPTSERLWNLAAIEAPRVWTDLGVRGEGIVIGQSDSGVQWDHRELRAAYRGAQGATLDHNYNWFDAWADAPAPLDDIGHGTHTLGSALGAAVGVAPGAQWIGCRNMERNLGNAAYYLDCLQFMLAPFPLDGDPFVDGDPARAPQVLNNSWGCPQATEGCDADSLQPALDALRAAGTFVVVSAGNDGPSCSSLDAAPAIYAASFTVGASTRSADLAAFSSVGPVLADGSNRIKPDLLAPGVEIFSSVADNQYASADGTSSAGPHIAGVVALLWSANPALIGDIATTEKILIETATPFTGTVAAMPFVLDAPCPLSKDAVPNVFAGYGIVNAYRAVERAMAMGE